MSRPSFPLFVYIDLWLVEQDAHNAYMSSHRCSQQREVVFLGTRERDAFSPEDDLERRRVPVDARIEESLRLPIQHRTQHSAITKQSCRSLGLAVHSRELERALIDLARRNS